MKNLVYIILFFVILSCQENKEVDYFSSKIIENSVFNSIDSLNKSISKADNSFYVLCRYDTLIIMSTKYPNTIYPTITIKKHISIPLKNKQIIITEPYRPIYNILDDRVKGKFMASTLPPHYSGGDYQKGVIYKIKDLNHLELIAKGDLRKYFYRIKEYEIPAPPPALRSLPTLSR